MDDMGTLAREQAVAQVKVMHLEPGDTLMVKVGIKDMGDGLPPWLPDHHELELVRDDLERVMPEGVECMVSHFGVECEVVRVGSESGRPVSQRQLRALRREVRSR